MLKVSPATVNAFAGEFGLQFVQRTAAFLHQEKIATHLERDALEAWIQGRWPSIAAEGLQSEQAIVFVLAIEASFACDVFTDPRTAAAIRGPHEQERVRLGRLAQVVETQFPPRPEGSS